MAYLLSIGDLSSLRRFGWKNIVKYWIVFWNVPAILFCQVPQSMRKLWAPIHNTVGFSLENPVRIMEIKTIMGYHLIPLRMATIKKSTNNKCWRGCGEKGTLLHCWWECKLVQPLWKTVWRLLKKLKLELPYDLEIPLLGIYLEKTKALIRKDTCTPVFIAALLTIAKTWKQPWCPSTEEWIKKMWCIHTHTHTHIHTYIHTYIHNGLLLGHKKEWNIATCSNMDGPRDYHTINRYILLYIKKINNKDLLYSTVNCI